MTSRPNDQDPELRLAQRIFIRLMLSRDVTESLADGADPELVHKECAERAWAAAGTFFALRPAVDGEAGAPSARDSRRADNGASYRSRGGHPFAR